MDDIGFILTCYLVSFGAVLLLGWRVVGRGRELSEQVPDEDKPWT
jgi:hypothetical protein